MLSAFVGLIGSLLLVVPPARDQWVRFSRDRAIARWRELPHDSGLAGFVREAGEVIGAAYEKERHAFSASDTAYMAFGAALLALSFFIDMLSAPCA